MNWLTIAVDATRRTIKNPNDTRQAFRLAEALSFGNAARVLRRYRNTDVGARNLRERRKLLDTLQARQNLMTMHPHSFGRAYLHFLDTEGITAEGLVHASIEGHAPLADPDEDYLAEQLRDMHDLWHTLLGYKGDLLGEGGVLAFSFAQLRHLGVGFLAVIGLVFPPTPALVGSSSTASGVAGAPSGSPPQDWEALLPLPLDQVRRQLHIDPVPAYQPVHAPVRR